MLVNRLPFVAASTSASYLGALVLLLWLFHAPAALAHEPDSGQCTAPGIDRARVLPDTMFGARLSPFGDVCFLARRVPLTGDPDQSTVIDFELWHDGTRVYRLPRPDIGLWPPACDSIEAVSFPADGDLRDIIVIGKCLGASDEQAQPLVYRAGSAGFTLDAELSTDLIGVDTVRAVEQRMHAKKPNNGSCTNPSGRRGMVAKELAGSTPGNCAAAGSAPAGSGHP